MQCDCYKEVKQLIQESITSQMPKGSDRLSFDLPQYRLTFDSEKMGVRAGMDVAGHYMAPKKGGGMKKVSCNTFIAASFCPFCGLKAVADQDEQPC